MKPITVHLVAYAHIDPVWMWTWQAGVDEALNTCRTACNLLDKYPDLVITRGEAWIYEQIRVLDPKLFGRMKTHAQTGRLSVVNGCWVQPDCNAPSAVSMNKQYALGKAWFKEHLGVDVTTGYMPDSFGHPAMTPAFLRRNGLDSYIFMRPEPHTKPLPSELFNWQAPTGETVLAQRIPGSYCARGNVGLKKNIEEAIKASVPDSGLAVAFYGICDHGGGPSVEQIEWIIKNKNFADGVTLQFSCPTRYFKAVSEKRLNLPTLVGELQFYGPGTYSAVRLSKREARLAETLAEHAEALVARFPSLATPGATEKMNDAWLALLFNQFHDIMSGTSIEAAYEHTRDELGYAKMVFRQVVSDIIRRKAHALPPCERRRVVLYNASSEPFSGYVETEPYLDFHAEKRPMRFLTQKGQELEIQKMDSNSAENKLFKYLVKADIAPFGEMIIETEPAPAKPVDSKVFANILSDEGKIIESATPAQPDENGIYPMPDTNHAAFRKSATLSNSKLSVSLCPTGISGITLGNASFIGPDGMRVVAYKDTCGTWGHYHTDGALAGDIVGDFISPDGWKIISNGPLRVTLSSELKHQQSRIFWQVKLDADEPVVRMRLRLIYNGGLEIIKLVVPLAFEATVRQDGVPGLTAERPFGKQEWPIQDFTTASVSKGQTLAVVTRDAYSANVETNSIGLTLVRSPNYCHHESFRQRYPDPHVFPFTDNGEHIFDITLIPSAGNAVATIQSEIERLKSPVYIAEATRGMPPMHHFDL